MFWGGTQPARGMATRLSGAGVARGWFFEDPGSGGWIGHGGGEQGVNTGLYIEPARDLGVVILSNGDVEDWGAWDAMIAALVEAAEGA